MSKHITIGFPSMKKEAGEKRAFMPEFIQFLTDYADVYLGEGYGGGLGFNFDDYRQGNPRVFKVSRQEAFGQDYIMILRAPNREEYDWIKPGSCLISMLHYPTRPNRVERLNNMGIKSISLDSIIDDNNLRLVENMRAVAWNGIEAAFKVLETRWPNLIRESPYQVLALGTGMVGKHAVEAATKLGNIEKNNLHMEARGKGSLAICVGRSISGNPQAMKSLMENSDILVDSTQRRDPSTPVIPNEWIAWLPEHAVVVDLAVDPYVLDHEPQIVRGVEGIPQGNLDKYVFNPSDPEWDESVPQSIPSKNRRVTVSCYSWPGIYPEACMAHYARQLEPLMDVLLTKGYDILSKKGGYFERALIRAKRPDEPVAPLQIYGTTSES